MNWKHDDLIDDLVDHLKGTGLNGSRMVWTDFPMGPSGSQRPDVFTLEKSFARPSPTVYEIKVSRSDFHADVQAGKWTGYRSFASRVIFCVPSGLVTRTEIPEQAGLMVRGENGWKALKKATVSGQRPGFAHMLKLLLLATDEKRFRDNARTVKSYLVQRSINERYGADVAAILADVDLAKAKIAMAEQEARRIIDRANAVRDDASRHAESLRAQRMKDVDDVMAEMRIAFGLPDDASRFDVLGRARRIANAMRDVGSGHADMLKKFSRQLRMIGSELEAASDQIKQDESDAVSSLFECL